jgi:2-oxoglutarate ferredoxin oxidoreductase subunit beta
MEKIYSRSASLTAIPSRFCPGCFHSLINKLVAETVDECGIRSRVLGIMPVGCGAMGKNAYSFDVICAAHGRAPAVATGASRCAPERIVFSYQGDGDLAAIGFSEIVHAANRGEHFLTIFVNNSTYGMTGGQMAPTTLIGQKTTTTPRGRDPDNEGYPIRMCEIIAQLEAPVYVARCALDGPPGVLKAKKALRKGFEIQMRREGFVFLEFLSNCPTNWGMTPVQCMDWIKNSTSKVFPAGVFRDKKEVNSHGK